MQTVPRLIEEFIPNHYNLSLTLDREARTFSGTVTVSGEVVNDHIALHAKSLTIKTVAVDGKDAAFKLEDNDQLTITQENLQPGKHIVVIGFSGEITDPMHGLYPCYYTHDGQKKELLATQFESHHAREVFPCVDEPAAKATFDVTLTTETDITVLGNMPVKFSREEDGKLVTSFETSPKMSVYLLAWVTGELHSVGGKTKNDIEVNVWATPAQSAASLEFALDAGIKTIEFFEEFFDTPYPLPKVDQVALPDFSSGAMENWGLITYREVALLADPKTTGISTKRYVSEVVAHELSHQWFGNLVTMKWWDNLWLNESFATIMAYIAVDALHPEWNFWQDFAANDTTIALRRDAIDGVQPVQLAVHHPDEIGSAFDPAIVYAKGGRLIRMLEEYVGTKVFRKGLKAYFAAHAYSNTEGSDLWDALSKASGKDIADFMNAWITQPGYPVVHVTEGGVSQEQFFVGEHKESSRLWPIPLAASDSALPEILTESELTSSIAPGVQLNIGATYHFIAHYSAPLRDALLTKVKNGEMQSIDRLNFLNEQMLLVRAGLMPSSSLISLLDAYKDETDHDVWSMMSAVLGELKKFVENDESSEKKLRALAGTLAAKEFARLGWDAATNEPETDTQLRSVILGFMAYSEDTAVISEAKQRCKLDALEELDPELRSLIMSITVRHTEDTKLAKELMDIYSSTNSSELQNDISAAVSSARDAGAISLLLEMLVDTTKIRAQDTFRWFAYLIRGRDSRAQAWQWMQDQWPWIEKQFSSDKSYDYFPRYAGAGLSTKQQLAEYKKFFAPLTSHPALSRAIALGVNEITARVELIERDGKAVREALDNIQ